MKLSSEILLISELLNSVVEELFFSGSQITFLSYFSLISVMKFACLLIWVTFSFHMAPVYWVSYSWGHNPSSTRNKLVDVSSTIPHVVGIHVLGVLLFYFMCCLSSYLYSSASYYYLCEFLNFFLTLEYGIFFLFLYSLSLPGHNFLPGSQR